MVSEKKEDKKGKEKVNIKKPEKPYKPQKDDNNKLVYDKVLTSGLIKNFISGKDVRRIATVMLYEKVGDMKIFEGTYPLLKGTQTKVFGEYCLLDYKKKMRFVDVPSSEDFVYCRDKKLGKIIEMVKYSEDDFRVYKKLDNTFYRKYKKPILEKVTYKDEESEEEYEVDEQKKDEKGNLLFETIEEEYKEPKGITQEARDVIRNGNEYELKMKEYRKTNQGFLDKYGQIVVPVAVLAVCSLMFIFAIKSTTEMMSDTASKLAGVKEALEKNPWYANEEIISQITTKIEQKKANEEAPPTK